MRWQTQTLFEVARALLGEREYELAGAVLSAGASRLSLSDSAPSSLPCPGSPSASGVLLALVKRNLVVSHALLERGDSAGAVRLLRSSMRPLGAYARFSEGRRKTESQRLVADIRLALGSSHTREAGELPVEAKQAIRAKALTSTAVWGWLATVERWCHRSE